MLKFQITLTEVVYTSHFASTASQTHLQKRTPVSVLFTHSCTARLCQLQPRSSPPLQRPCRGKRENHPDARGRRGICARGFAGGCAAVRAVRVCCVVMKAAEASCAVAGGCRTHRRSRRRRGDLVLRICVFGCVFQGFRV
jgi:hypothetical protein